MIEGSLSEVCFNFFSKDCVVYNMATAETHLLDSAVANLLMLYSDEKISIVQFEQALTEQGQDAQLVFDKFCKSKLMKI